VDLQFRSGGYIESIRQVTGPDGRVRNIDTGDYVKKGTVLALVSPQDYKDKLTQANAQLASAHADQEKTKLQFDRTAALYAAQSATKPDYDRDKAALDNANAAVSAAQGSVSEAQVALDYCSLKAPFDGWIVNRNVDVGSLVGPATNGFTLANTQIVKAVFGVPDTGIDAVRLGQHQSITTDSLPGNFDGRVTAISPAADPKSRVYSVEVSIPNTDGRLKSGMIASLVINGARVPKSVTAVPLTAIIRDPQKPNTFAVLIPEGNGDTVTVRSRVVEIGDAYGNLITVTNGLQPGERVVTTGATIVKDGEQVRLIP
jgi:multidrug efflux system membrane fusion protein